MFREISRSPVEVVGYTQSHSGTLICDLAPAWSFNENTFTLWQLEVTFTHSQVYKKYRPN